jgi:hypothetical protein
MRSFPRIGLSKTCIFRKKFSLPSPSLTFRPPRFRCHLCALAEVSRSFCEQGLSIFPRSGRSNGQRLASLASLKSRIPRSPSSSPPSHRRYHNNAGVLGAVSAHHPVKCQPKSPPDKTAGTNLERSAFCHDGSTIANTRGSLGRKTSRVHGLYALCPVCLRPTPGRHTPRQLPVPQRFRRGTRRGTSRIIQRRACPHEVSLCHSRHRWWYIFTAEGSASLRGQVLLARA